MNTITITDTINRHNTKALSKDVPITEENVRFRGERTAIRTVKTLLGRTGGDFMQRAFRDLLNDVDNFDIQGYVVTESYDIAQEATGFFCGYIGKKLTDLVIDQYGEPVTILKACFRYVNNYIMRVYRKSFKTVQIDEMPGHQFKVEFDWDAGEEDYTSVDKRISAMRLTPRQKELLDCRMAGMSMTKTAMALSVVKSSIRYSLRYIRLKYHKSFNHLSYCPDINELNLTACENRVVEHYLRGETILEIACALSVTRQAIERTLKRVHRKAQSFGNLPPAA